MGSCGRSDLILDRSRKLVGLQSPASCATRAGGDSGPDFEKYELRPLPRQARSWWANQDADVKR